MLLAVVLSFLLQTAPLSFDGLSEKQIALTKAAVAGLHSLGNKVAIGTTATEYKKQLAETKDTIDAAVSALPNGTIKERLIKALNFHEQSIAIIRLNLPPSPITPDDLTALRKDWPGFEPTKAGYLTKEDSLNYLWGEAAKIVKELEGKQ